MGMWHCIVIENMRIKNKYLKLIEVLCFICLLTAVSAQYKDRDDDFLTNICKNNIKGQYSMYTSFSEENGSFSCCRPPPGYEKVKDCEPGKPWTTQVQQIATENELSEEIQDGEQRRDNVANIICMNNIITTNQMEVVAGEMGNFECCRPPLGYKVAKYCWPGEPTTTILEQLPPDGEIVFDKNDSDDSLMVGVSKEVIVTSPSRLNKSYKDTSAVLSTTITISETNIPLNTAPPSTKPMNYGFIILLVIIGIILVFVVIMGLSPKCRSKVLQKIRKIPIPSSNRNSNPTSKHSEKELCGYTTNAPFDVDEEMQEDC